MHRLSGFTPLECIKFRSVSRKTTESKVLGYKISIETLAFVAPPA